jgi:hypothetical protein
MAKKTVMGRFSVALSPGSGCGDVAVMLAKTHKGAIKSAQDKGYRPEDVAMIQCTVTGRTYSKPPFKMREEHHLALKQAFNGLLNGNGR